MTENDVEAMDGIQITYRQVLINFMIACVVYGVASYMILPVPSASVSINTTSAVKLFVFDALTYFALYSGWYFLCVIGTWGFCLLTSRVNESPFSLLKTLDRAVFVSYPICALLIYANWKVS